MKILYIIRLLFWKKKLYIETAGYLKCIQEGVWS